MIEKAKKREVEKTCQNREESVHHRKKNLHFDDDFFDDDNDEKTRIEITIYCFILRF